MMRSPGFGTVAMSELGWPRATTNSTPTSEIAKPISGRTDGVSRSRTHDPNMTQIGIIEFSTVVLVAVVYVNAQ